MLVSYLLVFFLLYKKGEMLLMQTALGNTVTTVALVTTCIASLESEKLLHVCMACSKLCHGTLAYC